MANRLSRVELIKVNEILKERLVKTMDGFYEFVDGWDDARVGKEISADTQAAVIGKIRLELYGRIRQPAVKSDERITKLEEVCQNLMKEIAEIKLKHTRLCENLTVNRVLDVKHLK